MELWRQHEGGGPPLPETCRSLIGKVVHSLCSAERFASLVAGETLTSFAWSPFQFSLNLVSRDHSLIRPEQMADRSCVRLAIIRSITPTPFPDPDLLLPHPIQLVTRASINRVERVSSWAVFTREPCRAGGGAGICPAHRIGSPERHGRRHLPGTGSLLVYPVLSSAKEGGAGDRSLVARNPQTATWWGEGRRVPGSPPGTGSLLTTADRVRGPGVLPRMSVPSIAVPVEKDLI